MNELLPRKIRLIAMLCHLIWFAEFPISIAIFPVIGWFYERYLVSPNSLAGQYAMAGVTLVSFPTICIGLATLLTILFWRVNRKIHPFIDLCGRCSANFMLSFSLYSFTFFSFIALTCGIPETAVLGLTATIPFGLLLLLHLLLGTTGAMLARKGRVYHNVLSIKFFSEAS